MQRACWDVQLMCSADIRASNVMLAAAGPEINVGLSCLPGKQEQAPEAWVKLWRREWWRGRGAKGKATQELNQNKGRGGEERWRRNQAWEGRMYCMALFVFYMLFPSALCLSCSPTLTILFLFLPGRRRRRGGAGPHNAGGLGKSLTTHKLMQHDW